MMDPAFWPKAQEAGHIWGQLSHEETAAADIQAVWSLPQEGTACQNKTCRPPKRGAAERDRGFHSAPEM